MCVRACVCACVRACNMMNKTAWAVKVLGRYSEKRKNGWIENRKRSKKEFRAESREGNNKFREENRKEQV